MDELQLLREIRNDIPAATEAMVEGGRHQLLRRINSGVTEKSKGRRKKGLRIAVMSAATLGLVAVLVAGNVIGLAGWRGGASAEAAEILNKAAELSIKTADPVVKPGQYLKIDSTNLWLTISGIPDGSGVLGSNREVQWLDTERMTTYVPANRQDEWVMSRSGRIPTTFFDPEAKKFAMDQAKDMGDTSELLRANNGAFYDSPSSLPDTQELASYSRDPRMLLNGIYVKTLGAGQSIDGEALVFIADLLRTGVVPADLRAALFKAAALIPGVAVTDNQATLDGQTGVGIGRLEDVSHIRQDIIIDPGTGQLIGERSVLTEASGSVPAGTAIGWTTIHTSVVDSAP
jgi:hypothetical protein